MTVLDLIRENNALEIMDKTEVVVSGKCVVCGKRLDCGRLFVCEECMKDAPYPYCCRMECGEHEFCRNCDCEARKQPEKDCH